MQQQARNVSSDFDYETLLRSHLDLVFNERDVSRRQTALASLYNCDAVVVDPDGSHVGLAAISALVDALLSRFPDDFRFAMCGPVLGLGNVAYVAWQLGPPDGRPAVTGVDVVQLANGRIQTVHVLIEPGTPS